MVTALLLHGNFGSVQIMLKHIIVSLCLLSVRILIDDHAHARPHKHLCLQVSHYEESSDGIKLHFDRGHPAVHAKLLIGADGYFSKIRQQCLNDGPPEFAVGPPSQSCSFLEVKQTNLQI